jgi:hypothetical protein
MKNSKPVLVQVEYLKTTLINRQAIVYSNYIYIPLQKGKQLIARSKTFQEQNIIYRHVLKKSLVKERNKQMQHSVPESK